MADTFTIGELAQAVTGGNEAAVRKLLNDAGARLNEYKSDPTETVGRDLLVDLFALRAGDRVGRKVVQLLGENRPRRGYRPDLEDVSDQVSNL